MGDARTERLRRLTFGLLVLATFAAFFVMQRLKHEATVVLGVKAERFFSPPSKTHPVEHISFRIKRGDEVTVTIVDPRGDDIATLVRYRHLDAYRRLSLTWRGLTDAGVRAPDARYRVRVRLRNQGRSVILTRTFLLHTRPPAPLITSITSAAGATPGGPAILPQAGGRPVTIAFSLDHARKPALFVYRTDVTPARLVTRLSVAAGASTATWDGTVHAKRVPPGTYLVAIVATDVEGNVGSTPSTLPPAPAPGQIIAGHPGITVRYLGVQPPTGVTAAGQRIVFGVDARRGAYSWSVTRVGARHPRKHGSSTRPLLAMRAPNGISGAYVFTASAAGHTTSVPFLVDGGSGQRVLVVLPMITWLGEVALDDDGDGLPNTLASGDAVRIPRVFGGDGLPAAFSDRVAGVLHYLDRHHLRYDVATDLGLALHQGVAVAGHAGILLVGDERWVPGNVDAQLRTFTRRGGTVATLGIDSLLRGVSVSPTALTQPSAATSTDAFGARLDPPATMPGLVTNFLDRIGLFNGGGGQFSGYGTYQAIASLGSGGALLASAVTPDGRPVIAASRFGRGLVVRVGLADIGARLDADPNAAALMNRIWGLLAR